MSGGSINIAGFNMSAIKTPAPRPGPFLTLNTHDIELLTQSEGFDFLREHLAETYHYECVDNNNLRGNVWD